MMMFCITLVLSLFTFVSAQNSTDGHAYTVSDLVSGNFTVQTVSLSPIDSGSDWEANDVAQILVIGSTSKKIEAGTFKYQVYETEVKSFIASGDSPYFQCSNKGCDPTKGIALKYKTGTTGAFTLSLSFSLPKAQSTTHDFKIVLWGEDQDHEPYDFSASISFSYGTGP